MKVFRESKRGKKTAQSIEKTSSSTFGLRGSSVPVESRLCGNNEEGGVGLGQRLWLLSIYIDLEHLSR